MSPNIKYVIFSINTWYIFNIAILVPFLLTHQAGKLKEKLLT